MILTYINYYELTLCIVKNQKDDKHDINYSNVLKNVIVQNVKIK